MGSLEVSGRFVSCAAHCFSPLCLVFCLSRIRDSRKGEFMERMRSLGNQQTQISSYLLEGQ